MESYKKNLVNFFQEHKLNSERLPLGFTFSFPLQQLGLTKGFLIRWTKGFNCEGVVEKDVVELLEDALKRRGVSTFCDSMKKVLLFYFL